MAHPAAVSSSPVYLLACDDGLMYETTAGALRHMSVLYACVQDDPQRTERIPVHNVSAQVLEKVISITSARKVVTLDSDHEPIQLVHADATFDDWDLAYIGRDADHIFQLLQVILVVIWSDLLMTRRQAADYLDIPGLLYDLSGTVDVCLILLRALACKGLIELWFGNSVESIRDSLGDLVEAGTATENATADQHCRDGAFAEAVKEIWASFGAGW
ncbi:hypothetical protein CALCODRAFT_506071 [Calocera cornea HHB12733]|uniref:Uncharacterized protein n=1 Tax=Calocera cornea HHB12733 TaxID=1353952 RepID=A0A165JET7_9BASI|nr:hypothetical protein CALCODRAFT_506071 [Calocera cornea HHB12733]